MTDEDPESGSPGNHPVGRVLRDRREAMRLSGSELAERTGLTQAKVSRIETGRTAVTPEDVRTLAEALRMSASEIEDLVTRDGVRRTDADRMTQWRPGESGLARRQADIAKVELACREIWVFQPALVPGLLQTSGYAEAVMRPRKPDGASETAEADLADAVAGRLRRQRILKIPDKSFRFIMTESTLSNRLGSPEDMVAQVRRIRDIAKRPNVSIGIIPADAALALPPLNGFELLDDKWVMMDLFNTALSSQVVSDVQFYRDVFEEFADVAFTGIGPILDRYARLYLDRSAQP
ncbi:transcriptional regulator with XRE-family HTH domain [Actinoplanes lutulentus]|uniref:Helix-turn-helix protein n=1 Tax=Actinoplanes lutulentus TaxID=1287878 RepID=A0A327ZE60_9ACTN|nr:helix-turn-helix transcriptional regulator [Actinoplanes lutulentus]MBB2942863.1 transcriptional regulator with XRE-family HTH domain [Actinoplanes lutulentus]RAK38442.1 helix-turn-helix protein [Actinoplanes lutulentus]